MDRTPHQRIERLERQRVDMRGLQRAQRGPVGRERSAIGDAGEIGLQLELIRHRSASLQLSIRAQTTSTSTGNVTPKISSTTRCNASGVSMICSLRISPSRASTTRRRLTSL
ncbi:hypothetical protein ACVILH_000567 [Bradyrhizobium sp. USDA 4353]